MKLRNTKNLFIVLVLLSLSGLACSGIFKGKEAAQNAVETFHQRLAEQKYAEIYENLADDFKKTTTEEEANQLFEAVNRKLGKVKSASLQSWKSNATTSGSYTVLIYETEFEQDNGTENFTFAINGDQAKIAGYHVNSKAFMK